MPPKQGKPYTGEPGYKLLPGEDTVEDHELRRCKYCGTDIAFLKSAQGKPYPVTVNKHGSRSHSGNLIVRRNNFHNCRGKK